MARAFTFFIILLSAHFLQAAEVAASLSLNITDLRPKVADVAQQYNLQQYIEDTQGVTQLRAFLIATPQNTLQLVYFLKAEDSEIFLKQTAYKLPFVHHTFTKTADWIVGTPDGITVDGETISQLEALANAPTPTIARFEVNPTLTLNCLKADPAVADRLNNPELKPLINELESIETIDLRGTTNQDAIRIIGIVKTKAGTPLNEFLNQRLPTKLDGLFARVSTEAAPCYGYTLFNTEALAKYTEHLRGVLTPVLERSGEVSLPLSITPQTPSEFILPASGQVAFTLGQGLQVKQLVTGNWTATQTEGLLAAQAKIAHEKLGDTPVTSESAFDINGIPVWVTKEESRPVAFCALYKGNLVSAPSREIISRMIDDLIGEDPITPSLTTNFNYYPTVCAQLFFHPLRFTKALNTVFPFGSVDIPADLSDTPVYMAASLGKGQIAITVDIPAQTIKALQALATAQRAQANAQTPIDTALKVPEAKPTEEPQAKPETTQAPLENVSADSQIITPANDTQAAQAPEETSTMTPQQASDLAAAIKELQELKSQIPDNESTETFPTPAQSSDNWANEMNQEPASSQN